MSVVNQMLRDLENRQRQPAADGSDYQPPQARVSRRFWVTGLSLIAVLMIVLSAYFIFDSSSSANTTSERPTKPQILDSEGSKPKPDNQPQPVQQAVSNQTQVKTSSTEQAVNDELHSDSDRSIEGDVPADKVESVPATESAKQNEDVSPVANHDSPNPERSSGPTTEPGQAPSLTASEEAETEVKAEAPESKPEPSLSIQASNIPREQRLRQSAKAALSRQDWAQAIQALSALSREVPEDHAVRKELIGLLVRTGSERQAARLLNQAVQQYPDKLEYRIHLAQLIAGQEPQQALQLLSGLKPLVYDYPGFYRLRAQLSGQMENWSQSLADYQQLVTMNNKNGRWALGAAIALDKLDRYQEAINFYRRAVFTDNLPPSARQFAERRLDALGG